MLVIFLSLIEVILVIHGLDITKPLNESWIRWKKHRLIRVEPSRLRAILRCLEFKVQRVEQALHSASLIEAIIQSVSYFRQVKSYEKDIFRFFLNRDNLN